MKPKKWMPKIGEKYWYISFYTFTYFTPCSLHRQYDEGSTLFKFNCFKTKKLALEAARKIRKVLS